MALEEDRDEHEHEHEHEHELEELRIGMRMLSISLGLVQAVLCALEITSGDKPAAWPLLVKITQTFMFFFFKISPVLVLMLQMIV